MTTANAEGIAPGWRDTLAVYLKPRVLIVLFLGFSAGLPLALSGSTLSVWMREVGVDLGTIGLFMTLMLLFVRFLPMISIFEMRTILPEAKVEVEERP